MSLWKKEKNIKCIQLSNINDEKELVFTFEMPIGSKPFVRGTQQIQTVSENRFALDYNCIILIVSALVKLKSH